MYLQTWSLQHGPNIRNMFSSSVYLENLSTAGEDICLPPYCNYNVYTLNYIYMYCIYMYMYCSNKYPSSCYTYMYMYCTCIHVHVYTCMYACMTLIIMWCMQLQTGLVGHHQCSTAYMYPGAKVRVIARNYAKLRRDYV